MAYKPQDDGIVISKPFGALGFPIDSRSLYYDKINFVRRAFISTAEAISYFDTALKRKGKFIIYINSTGTLNSDGTITGGEDKAYEWRGGTSDGQLVPIFEKGDKGDKGDTGIQGETGLTGSQGIQGEIGLTGDKGDKGWTKNELYEEYTDLNGEKHLLKKFIGYINGEGIPPTDSNIGKYVKADLTYTTDKEEAADFKGDFIMALYFEVDDNMDLIAYIPDNYDNLEFSLDDTGHLIIEQTV